MLTSIGREFKAATEAAAGHVDRAGKTSLVPSPGNGRPACIARHGIEMALPRSTV
jgi:hypothetical protein